MKNSTELHRGTQGRN